MRVNLLILLCACVWAELYQYLIEEYHFLRSRHSMCWLLLKVVCILVYWTDKRAQYTRINMVHIPKCTSEPNE